MDLFQKKLNQLSQLVLNRDFIDVDLYKADILNRFVIQYYPGEDFAELLWSYRPEGVDTNSRASTRIDINQEQWATLGAIALTVNLMYVPDPQNTKVVHRLVLDEAGVDILSFSFTRNIPIE